uniref:Protein m131 n=1 Tax=Mastomys natalensis cytomegalovirus 2 TaxID=2973540 RepID=A0A9Y1IMJ1_9BETA|nr:protein m131 [Mastomys natalensis cytomegalovirus 2]WEG69259.1 protein m131 [Mastomys natalensis cytomegalovirus 2]WEG69398.1 protein m131 [Mastomys natalensis cytomegalovirus 2]WEG69536.1 protein m131 [Mastomys natalensis cytomegalovirus 2]WEG69674.1 protein m131 [Mastomys natalensis cytomegalovirus 2]
MSVLYTFVCCIAIYNFVTASIVPIENFDMLSTTPPIQDYSDTHIFVHDVCCRWIPEPIPFHAITDAIRTRSSCGDAIIFTIAGNTEICVPARGWANSSMCFVQERRDGRQIIISVFEELLDAFYYEEDTAVTVPLLATELLHVSATIIRSPKIQRRSYNYRVWDGDHWLTCICEITLRANATLLPYGIGPSAPLTLITYTVDVTFSAESGDLFTRCTHNHVYQADLYEYDYDH